MKLQAIVAAAGAGARLGADLPKALVDLAGKPMLVRTLERLAFLESSAPVIVLFSPGSRDLFQSALRESAPEIPVRLVEGGAERQISVWNGLEALEPDTEIVVIHDAARPFVARQSVLDSIDAAAECGASTVALPCTDTILHADPDAWLLDTPDRRALWACQTPQTFRVDVIRHAHDQAARENYLGTDDASLVSRIGERVRLVRGTPLNFKITNPADLALAGFVLKEGLAG